MITKETHVLVQGMTGKEGQRASKEMINSGIVVSCGVTPGKGGQQFKPSVLGKVRELRRRKGIEVGVDGGVQLSTATMIARAGANVLVSGTAIYGSDDPAKAMKALQRQARR